MRGGKGETRMPTGWMDTAAPGPLEAREQSRRGGGLIFQKESLSDSPGLCRTKLDVLEKSAEGV